MKAEDFQKLFHEDEVEFLGKENIRRLWQFLNSRGVADPDINRLVSPVRESIRVFMRPDATPPASPQPSAPTNKRVQTQLAEERNVKRKEYVNQLRRLIDDKIVEWNIDLLAEPVREQKVVKPIHRRLDALARLLALDETESACVAVALADDNIIVSFNAPRATSENKTREKITDIQDTIQKKLNIIRQFLYNGIALIKQTQGGNGDGEHLNVEIYKMALEAVSQLKQLSHSAKMLPKEKRHASRLSIEDHYSSALVKLLTSAAIAPEEGGFDPQERDALLISKQAVFLIPKLEAERTMSASLHAEQIITTYLKELATPEKPIYIGISKLCCAACKNVLADTPNILFRGSHGITFPNVADVRTHSPATHRKMTRLDSIQQASDSESESELSESDVKKARHYLSSSSGGESPYTPRRHSHTLFGVSTRELTIPTVEEKEEKALQENGEKSITHRRELPKK